MSFLLRNRASAVRALVVFSIALRRAFAVFAFVLGLSATVHAASKEWAPLDASDLAAKASTSAPGADLEILFSRHTLDNVGEDNWTDNYVRAKVYTARGVEKISVFKIEYPTYFKVRSVAARVVKPNGSIAILGKGDFHETTTVKWNGGTLKTTSFAFPNVEPGDIVEYRWSQATENGFYSYWMYGQEAVPVRDFVFEVKGSASDFNLMAFNMPNVETKKASRYEGLIHVRNLPPFEEEELMPPQRDFRGSLIVVSSPRYLRHYTSDEVWKNIGEYDAEEFRLATEPSPEIKRKATQLIAGTTTPEEKLARLYDFCQKEVSNLDRLNSTELMEAKEKREKAEDVQSAAQTFSRRTGLPIDINRLFASLARALGFDVRLGLSANREEILNVRTDKGWLFLDRTLVAVKIGDAWKYYSPGEYFVPAGLLSPKDEMVTVYVCDEKKSWYETTPVSPVDQSIIKRKGRFTLTEDGALDGEVEIRMNGHAAVDQKETWWGKEESEATKQYREKLVANVPTAELSDITWENLKNNVSPVVLHCKIHIPGYAEVAGSRLVLSPCFFEAGKSPLFTAETRKYPVIFNYGYKQLDDIEIVWPEGYTIEGASSPANVGTPADLIEARYGIRIRPKARVLAYQRECVVGNGAIALRAESYGTLKKIFEDINRSDRHSFILKPKPPVAEATTTAAPTAK